MVGPGQRGDTRDGLIQPFRPGTGAPMIPARLSRLLRYPAAAALVASLAGGSIGAIPASAALTYSTDTPMILPNVSPEDLRANTRGVCNGPVNILGRHWPRPAQRLEDLHPAPPRGRKAGRFFPSAL